MPAGATYRVVSASLTSATLGTRDPPHAEGRHEEGDEARDLPAIALVIAPGGSALRLGRHADDPRGLLRRAQLAPRRPLRPGRPALRDRAADQRRRHRR